MTATALLVSGCTLLPSGTQLSLDGQVCGQPVKLVLNDRTERQAFTLEVECAAGGRVVMTTSEKGTASVAAVDAAVLLASPCHRSENGEQTMRRLMIVTAAATMALAVPTMAAAAECYADRAFSGGQLRVLQVDKVVAGVVTYTWRFRTVEAVETAGGTVRVRVNGMIVDISGCDTGVVGIMDDMNLFMDDINQAWN